VDRVGRGLSDNLTCQEHEDPINQTKENISPQILCLELEHEAFQQGTVLRSQTIQLDDILRGPTAIARGPARFLARYEERALDPQAERRNQADFPDLKESG